jgi:hypothetical protein
MSSSVVLRYLKLKITLVTKPEIDLLESMFGPDPILNRREYFDERNFKL